MTPLKVLGLSLLLVAVLLVYAGGPCFPGGWVHRAAWALVRRIDRVSAWDTGRPERFQRIAP